MMQAQAIKEGILREGDSLLKPAYYFSPEIDVETMDNAWSKLVSRGAETEFSLLLRVWRWPAS